VARLIGNIGISSMNEYSIRPHMDPFSPVVHSSIKEQHVANTMNNVLLELSVFTKIKLWPADPKDQLATIWGS
jgi:hypothetical protein